MILIQNEIIRDMFNRMSMFLIQLVVQVEISLFKICRLFDFGFYVFRL